MMNRLTVQIGFWSALSCAATFLVFTVCFVAVFATSPLFSWTNLTDYVTYVNTNSLFFQNLARLSMLLFGPLFLVLLNTIHRVTPDNKKILTQISLCLGSVFTALVCVHYFVQLGTVRLSIQAGQTTGLEQWVQANPFSGMTAVNLLGWTVFLGLCSLFLVPVFSGRGLETVIRYCLLINGLSCLIGGVAYLFQIEVLIFLLLNFGMGGAVTILTIALCRWFQKVQPQP